MCTTNFHEGDVTQDDSQQGFLVQHSVANLLGHFFFNSDNLVPTLERCVALKNVFAKNRIV